MKQKVDVGIDTNNEITGQGGEFMFNMYQDERIILNITELFFHSLISSGRWWNVKSCYTKELRDSPVYEWALSRSQHAWCT